MPENQIPISVALDKVRTDLITYISQISQQYEIPLAFLVMLLKQIVVESDLASANEYIQSIAQKDDPSKKQDEKVSKKNDTVKEVQNGEQKPKVGNDS